MPWRLNGNTFSTACADIDNDSDLDLFNGPDAAGSVDVYEGVRANCAVTLVQGGGAVYAE